MPALTIGRLAAAAGVHVETVRYYQRRGLLAQPARPLGGVRLYDSDQQARLQFIRRAQAVGFTLDEIAGLLAVHGRQACEETRQLTRHRLAEVRHRMDELRHLEADLEQLVAACDVAAEGERCPTLCYLETGDGNSASQPGVLSPGTQPEQVRRNDPPRMSAPSHRPRDD